MSFPTLFVFCRDEACLIRRNSITPEQGVKSNMDLTAEQRLSDSPFVEQVWRNRSDEAGAFISMAFTHWQLVVTRIQGQTLITVRGPETKASPAFAPAGAEFVGIMFKFGTFMPHLPVKSLVDTAINLPDAPNKSFWLHSSPWEAPTFENADTFIERLVRAGMLVREPMVEAALHGRVNDLSQRSAQRRFLHATGLTQTTTRQVERARKATALLKQGTSILDTVFKAGYFDQPHLTRSLKQYIGQTPAQIMDEGRQERLSLLYNTTLFE